VIAHVGHVFDDARSPHGETLKTPTLASWSGIRASTGVYLASQVRITGNPPYSISPYSAVKRYSGKGDTTLHDAPPLRSAGRISSGTARRYHLVAVPPLDLGAMLTADRP
jgi:hypothetical protein